MEEVKAAYLSEKSIKVPYKSSVPLGNDSHIGWQLAVKTNTHRVGYWINSIWFVWLKGVTVDVLLDQILTLSLMLFNFNCTQKDIAFSPNFWVQLKH